MYSNVRYLSIVLAIGVATTSGCEKSPTRDASASGTVLVDDQLVHGGTVTFHPVEKGPLAVGRILNDGTFTVRTGQGNLSDVDGGTLKPGEYKVTVIVTGDSLETVGEDGPPQVGPRLMAEKYASVETTDLKETVKAGDNLFVFELERAEKEVVDEDIGDDEEEPETKDEADSSAADADETNQADSDSEAEAATSSEDGESTTNTGTSEENAAEAQEQVPTEESARDDAEPSSEEDQQ